MQPTCTDAKRRSGEKGVLCPLPGSDRSTRALTVSVAGPSLLSAALQTLLASFPEFRVLRGGSPPSFAAEIRLVVLGNAFGGGPSWCQALRQAVEQQRQDGGGICLVLNALEDPVRVRETASCQGVRVYVTLKDDLSDLQRALIAAAKGEAYCSPRLVGGVPSPCSDSERDDRTSGVIPDVRRPQAEVETGESAALKRPLSERQWEVAKLTAQGLSNQEIGERLFIDITTVKSHLTEVYLKLGIKRRTQVQARIGDAFREEVSPGALP